MPTAPAASLRARRAPAPHAAVRRACDFLDAHADRRVALDELARAAFMSKFHLLRKFKEALGVTPGQYQVLMRLARARTLLEDGVRVAEVAYGTGFADQAHLTRAFKQTYGVTPARYAAMAAHDPALAGTTGDEGWMHPVANPTIGPVSSPRLAAVA
jgi:AraC-like DNA-binding protein